MSQPNKDSEFITHSCQNCGGHIKFDSNLLNPGETRRVECPHCHLETIIFIPQKKDKATSPVKHKSSRIELFIFELTRFPAVIVALAVLVALIVISCLAYKSIKPEKPIKPPVITYEMVAPVPANEPKPENTFIPHGAKIAAKNLFPQPVADFLMSHEGFSLKEWLDQLPTESRQPFLENLAKVLQTAENKAITDQQLKQVVSSYSEMWIATAKYDAELQEKIVQEKQIRLAKLMAWGFQLLITLMILSLILVLLAIERNTRPGNTKT
jgi:hypothetical protein